MAGRTLLIPTLHVEILLRSKQAPSISEEIRTDIAQYLTNRYVTLQVGYVVRTIDEDVTKPASLVEFVAVTDYTGPQHFNGHHKLEEVQLDVQLYTLKNDQDPRERPRRRISQPDSDDNDVLQGRILALPNLALRDEWDSLIYDDALPSQLLRYLTRMLGVMKQPGLNLSTFNWNRLCLLHGPPGSGKSTLCRGLAQKLSIRLSQTFPHSVLVEVNTSSVLSKYFGESGKLINSLFQQIHSMAQSSSTLICVVMDEIESIAASREQGSLGGECNDGLRATNQLLTALDRLRPLPNIIVMCTSNLLEVLDPAFLDRVDIKQFIPSPSAAAIYEIFRSCLNELVRTGLINNLASQTLPQRVPVSENSSSPAPPPVKALKAVTCSSQEEVPSPNQSATSSPEKLGPVLANDIPTLAETQILHQGEPSSPGWRIWTLAQKCEGFSGRTLRRLPILGLAMYTWGGACSLQDAVSALDAAVDQEVKAKQGKKDV